MLILLAVRSEKRGARYFNSYLCGCGNIKAIDPWKVRNNITKSCGCLRQFNGGFKKGLDTFRKGTRHPGHLGYGTSEHRCWANIKARCTDPKNPRFESYQRRGITLCKRWNVFANFYQDMGSRPKGTVIVRRNMKKGYSPSNCYWGSIRDSYKSHYKTSLEINGISKPVTVWCREFGVSYSKYYGRVKRCGMTPQEALTLKGRKVRSNANL